MTASRALDARPWTPSALRLTLAANVVAAVLLVVAWYGVAGEARLADATPWANLSAVGLVVAGFGNAQLILVARARIGARQAVLRRSRTRARTRSDGDGPRVALAGGRLYHRPDCRLVTGKPAEPVAAANGVTLAPCGWCRP